MRILALVSDGLGARGGIAEYNRNLFAALSQCSAVSSVKILPRHGGGDAPAPAKCEQQAPIGSRVGWTARAGAQAIRESFDVVFCGHLFSAPVAAILAKRRKLWIQVHGVEAWPEPAAFVRYAVECADLVTSVSRYTRTRLLRWSDVDSSRVRVLSNTFSSRYEPRPRRDDLVALHGLQGRKVILTVGRLASGERYKGHDQIIAALPEIAKRCANASYLIVGGGDDEARLRRLALSMSVSDRVIFAGQVVDEDLPDYFALGDVFAMPSSGEGFGIVFLEAARSGLPIIGGAGDGSVDALADGEIGLLVDSHDLRQLVDAVASELNRCGSTSRGPVDRFAFSNFSRHVDDLVRSLA